MRVLLLGKLLKPEKTAESEFSKTLVFRSMGTLVVASVYTTPSIRTPSKIATLAAGV